MLSARAQLGDCWLRALYRVSGIAPSIDAPGQRADIAVAALNKHFGHFGRRHLVGAGTIQNDSGLRVHVWQPLFRGLQRDKPARRESSPPQVDVAHGYR